MQGTYTALITPFLKDNSVDIEGLKKLVAFQIENGIDGILATGTTGESPVLTWQEHNEITEVIGKETNKKVSFISGAGSNNTKEAFSAVEFAKKFGADTILLVDPYYNGPSSLEIRKEYIEPIAQKYPELTIIPYTIPGRTGTMLLPEDIAIIYEKYENVCAVKEASGNLNNMKKIREFCGKQFTILSGDDPLTCDLIHNKDILASGTFSVVSNIVPKFVTEMVKAGNEKDFAKMEKLNEALKPLNDIVTVITEEDTKFGKVKVKARNPLAIKTIMNLLGMPSGVCRRPLGKMTKKGFDVVLSALRETFSNNPEFFLPIEEFFGVKIKERIENPEYSKDLIY